MEETFFKTVKAAFAHRRKTLVNCLVSAGLFKGKEEAAEALKTLGLAAETRGETLTLDDFARLAGVVEGNSRTRADIRPLTAKVGFMEWES